MTVFRKTLLKSELARALGISSRTLTRFFSKHEDRIKECFPDYNKKSTLLFPNVVDYVLEKHGFTWEEIIENLNTKAKK